MLDIKQSSDFLKVNDSVNVYSCYDIDFNFKKINLFNTDAYDQAIEHLIMTEKGERLFNLDFGSAATQYLFENNTNSSSIMSSIYNTIEYYIPITIDRTTTDVSFRDSSHVITIHFKYSTNDGVITGHEFNRQFTE